MHSNKHNLEFYYDISCPFAYIASTRVEALASRTNANLIWTPVLLGAIYRLTAAPQGAAGSASDVFNSAKKAVSSASFSRTLKRYKIPYNPASTHLRKTTAALRLIHHVPNAERPQLTKALFKAYWVDSEDVTDHKVLLDIAKRSGIPSAKDMTEAVFGNDQDRRSLETATDQVIARGSPGVPAFWIEDEIWTDAQQTQHQGRLYWGQDRMLFVEAVLRGLEMSKPFDQVPGISSLHPRCVRNASPDALKKRVQLEFWYDFSSPWAFLGWTQLERLQKICGPGLEIEMKPILLGALFREIGAPMVPMAAVSEQKRNYGMKDLSDWPRYWNAVNAQEHTLGKPIEFRYPDEFPIRSPALLRCAIVNPSCVPVLYRACWEQNINVAQEKTLAQTLSSAGFDAPKLLKQANEQNARDILRSNTQMAKDIGLCGVPSYRVSHMTPQGWKTYEGVVWGQDETNVVLDLIAGWDEKTSQDMATVGVEHEVHGASKL